MHAGPRETMRHHTRSPFRAVLALLAALVATGCGDDADLANINTSESRGLAGAQSGNVVLEPSLETLELRPPPNPDREAFFGDLHVLPGYSFDARHDELYAVWRDPDFDARRAAIYYLRAVENPICRWSWSSNLWTGSTTSMW